MFLIGGLKMSSPLISLIIPVYNVEPYLSSCLDSIINQSYQNLEIILVNDGSTDGSRFLCEQYKQKDSRIILINQKNQGLSSARNTGINSATGKYLSFIDSDDEVKKDYVKYLYSLIKRASSPVKISVCPHYLKKESGELKNFNAKNFPSKTLSVPEALEKMLNENGFNLQSTSKLYFRDLFKTIRFPEKKLHEDVGTTYRLFLEAAKSNNNAKIAFGKTPEYIYNLRSSSITNKKFNLKKLDLIELTDQMCSDLDEAYPALKDTTNLRRLHARFSILRQIIHQTNKTDKAKKLEKSLIHYIKENKTWITKNPKSTKRDKLALYSLLLGKNFFQFSWNLYEKFFK